MAEFVERRSNLYTFMTMNDLLGFYANFIPRDDIEKIIIDSRHDFVERQGATQGECKLQFISKCEQYLQAFLAKTPVLPSN